MSSAWRIEYELAARKQLKRLSLADAERIVRTLQRDLERHGDPRGFGSGLVGDWTGYWRYRIGDYRVICRIADAVVTVFVIEVGHRSAVYR